MASILRVLVALLPAVLPAQTPPAPKPEPAPAEPRVVAPRADDDKELAPLLTKARQAVEKGADGAVLLASREFAPLRELTPFRELVRERAPRGEVLVCGDDEPGQRLVVRATVKDKQGKPVADALVYAYHTSSKGWYSDKAPHFSGNGGDVGHARLFGYVRTDADGRFVLRTIRPAGYPRSDLPEHIHLHIDVDKKPVLGSEILFDDDARLTKEMREQHARHGLVPSKVTKGAGGEQVVEPEFVVERPASAKAGK